MAPDVTTHRIRERTRSPSRFSKRLIVLGGALIGFGIATRLAAYQFRLLPPPADPLFGGGSERVLNSPLSRALPIPDAALGAVAYLLEAILLITGSSQRFATMPLIVLIYAAVAALMGIVGCGLTVYQIVALRTACTLCLGSALLSIVLVIPAFDEARAALARLLATQAHTAGGRR